MYFNETYLYLNFQSENGCSLDLTYNPNFILRAKRKNDEEFDFYASDKKPPDPLPKDDPYYQEMLLMEQKRLEQLK